MRKFPRFHFAKCKFYTTDYGRGVVICVKNTSLYCGLGNDCEYKDAKNLDHTTMKVATGNEIIEFFNYFGDIRVARWTGNLLKCVSVNPTTQIVGIVGGHSKLDICSISHWSELPKFVDIE